MPCICGCTDGLVSLLLRNKRVAAKTALAVPIVRERMGSWTSPLPRAQFDREITPSPDDFDWNDGEVMSLDASPKAPKRQDAVAMAADTDAGRRLGPMAAGARGGHFLTQQLFSSPGGLPAPLTAKERLRRIQEIRPTATIELLDQVPRELLEATGMEPQALRRRLLNNATIVFFTAGYEAKRFVFERALALGVKSVIIEHPDSWARSLVDEGVIAKFIPIDMSQDPDAVFADSLAAIRALAKDPATLDADGIATFCELSVPVVARLAEELGLPGHRPEAVDRARDKHRTRAEMGAAGLPVPKNFAILSASDLGAAAAAVGFPAVLKPVSGAASLGVKKVYDEDDLRASYDEVVTELRGLVVSSGALIKPDSNDCGVDAGKVIDCTILLEQYLDGPEVDVDVVMSGGEWRYAAVTDNGPTLEPYFNETWAVCPSLLPSSQQKELKELAIASVKCLGFVDGVFHVECKMTSHGPHLIEVNARMGGGQVHETNFRVWGVDLVEETLFAAVGIPSRPYIPSRDPPGGAVAYCDINATRTGMLENLDFLKPLRTKEGVVWARPYIEAGAKVVGPADGLPTWIAEIVVQRSSSKAALDYLFELQDSVDPTIL